MRIKWLGHSCFLLTAENGMRILADPFNDEVGYRLPAEEADIVTTSHNHFDHNNISIVKGEFTHINQTGRFFEKGIIIEGIPTFHDTDRGAKRGKNTIFKYSIDDITVCHCGDLGHVLTPEQVKDIGEIDILLVPVGGTFTINAEGACEVVRQLRPLVTIPMHYKTDAMNFKIDSVDKFIKVSGGGEWTGIHEVEISSDSLSSLPGIIVMDYK